MKRDLPKKSSSIKLLILPLALTLALAGSLVFGRNAMAFFPFDFLKALPIFGGGRQQTPEDTIQTLDPLPLLTDTPQATSGAAQPQNPVVNATNPSAVNAVPPVVKKTVVASDIISPVPNLEEMFKVTIDKFTGQKKITTLGKIVTPVAVADLAMDTKKVQGKTLFDSNGHLSADYLRVKSSIYFGNGDAKNYYIDSNAIASLNYVVVERDLDVLQVIHNSKKV